MQSNDAQKVWSDYYQRKRSQRIEEATALWERMQRAGVVEGTVLELEFVHFGNSKEDIEALTAQLSENYEVRTAQGNEPNYWYAKGATRPHGVTLNREQLLGWVAFMADVAQSYACVFSAWSLSAPSHHAEFRSEDVESAS